MVTDEGNVRLRQHELQLYFERLLGVRTRCSLQLVQVHWTAAAGSILTPASACLRVCVSVCRAQEAGLLADPEVRDTIGLSEEASMKIQHLLTDV
jgi:hypothetical protein